MFCLVTNIKLPEILFMIKHYLFIYIMITFIFLIFPVGNSVILSL